MPAKSSTAFKLALTIPLSQGLNRDVRQLGGFGNGEQLSRGVRGAQNICGHGNQSFLWPRREGSCNFSHGTLCVRLNRSASRRPDKSCWKIRIAAIGSAGLKCRGVFNPDNLKSGQEGTLQLPVREGVTTRPCVGKGLVFPSHFDGWAWPRSCDHVHAKKAIAGLGVYQQSKSDR